MSSSKSPSLLLSPQDARRLAITRQQLAGPRPQPDAAGLMKVMRAIRCLQLDPISAVARSPLLVLWSRLGNYDPALLQRALWRDRQLFEYWAHAASIVLVDDWPVHRLHMAQRANGGWRPHTRQWLEENRALREHILERLERDGPLAPGDFDGDVVEEEWHSTGWTNQRTVNQMLDCLWTEGRVMVAGRRGRTRLWDLTHRCLPPDVDAGLRPDRSAVIESAVQLSLRALGVGTARHIREHFTRGRYHDLDRAIERLVQQGLLRPVQIEADGEVWPGEWFIHADDVPLLQQLQNGAWQPRTTLLSPFDNLICDRDRTEELFDFYFRIEIYVSAAKREYGYYVLPILHGDRLVGRIDPRYDQKNKQLLVHAVYAEGHAADDETVGQAAAQAITELANFLGANEIIYRTPAPAAWQDAMSVTK